MEGYLLKIESFAKTYTTAIIQDSLKTLQAVQSEASLTEDESPPKKGKPSKEKSEKPNTPAIQRHGVEQVLKPAAPLRGSRQSTVPQRGKHVPDSSNHHGGSGNPQTSLSSQSRPGSRPQSKGPDSSAALKPGVSRSPQNTHTEPPQHGTGQGAKNRAGEKSAVLKNLIDTLEKWEALVTGAETPLKFPRWTESATA